MPHWTNAPPKDAAGPSLPVLRTPTHKPLTAICTSKQMLGTYTHFYHGHTVPCDRPDCLACGDGIPYRWHGYFAAYRTTDALHFLFECTAQAAEIFTLYAQAHGELRGCFFCARRHHNKPNGRVLIQTKPADLTHLILPKPPQLDKVLAVLWHLPADSVSPANTDPERHVRNVNVQPGPNPAVTPPPATESFDPAGIGPIRIGNIIDDHITSKLTSKNTQPPGNSNTRARYEQQTDPPPEKPTS